jgi:hypothetical protein
MHGWVIIEIIGCTIGMMRSTQVSSRKIPLFDAFDAVNTAAEKFVS